MLGDGNVVAVAPVLTPPDTADSWSIRDGFAGPAAGNDSGTRQPAIPLGNLWSDDGVSVLSSLGFAGAPLLGSSIGGYDDSSHGMYFTNPDALGYLVDHSLDIREFAAAPGTVTSTGQAVDAQIQGVDAFGNRVGVVANVAHINEDAFGLAVLAGAALVTAGIATAATGAVDGAVAASSSTGYDAWSAYLATGASDGSTIGGLGGYAGAVGAGAAPEVLTAAVVGSSTSWSLAGAWNGLLESFAPTAPSSSSSSVLPGAAASSAPSLFGPGGVLGAIGQAAGLVSTGAGLYDQFTGGASSSTRPGTPVPSSSSSSPRLTLLLLAGAAVAFVVLRKKA